MCTLQHKRLKWPFNNCSATYKQNNVNNFNEKFHQFLYKLPVNSQHVTTKWRNIRNRELWIARRGSSIYFVKQMKSNFALYGISMYLYYRCECVKEYLMKKYVLWRCKYLFAENKIQTTISWIIRVFWRMLLYLLWKVINNTRFFKCR